MLLAWSRGSSRPPVAAPGSGIAEIGPLSEHIVERAHSDRSVSGVRGTSTLSASESPAPRYATPWLYTGRIARRPRRGARGRARALEEVRAEDGHHHPGNPPHGVKNVMVGEQPPGSRWCSRTGCSRYRSSCRHGSFRSRRRRPSPRFVPRDDPERRTGVPPISTLVTIGLSKFVPVITTTHPAGPLVGENDETVGEAADAGASRPSTTRAPHDGDRRYAQSHVSSEGSHARLTSCKRYSPIRYLSATVVWRSLLALREISSSTPAARRPRNRSGALRGAYSPGIRRLVRSGRLVRRSRGASERGEARRGELAQGIEAFRRRCFQLHPASTA